MESKNSQALRPGEIKLGFLPIDWPLTPLNAQKAPYVQGWQNKPFSVTDIEKELIEGQCKAIGLLGGPVYNKPYGHVWVDIDGPSVYQVVEQLAALPFEQALPPTLTICSGKEGRERKLYQLPKSKWEHLLRNKYVWHATEPGEKLEILWRRHQGVVMGLHPETEGYFTKEGQGFEWIQELPELPAWLMDGIINKNVQKGKPAEERTRMVGPGFAINQRINVERDMALAHEAMWALPPEAADDYDIWIMVGQSLHELDDSLLDDWDEWSKQSDKYRPGECLRRWQSFSKNGGVTIGSLIHAAKENGWTAKQDHMALPVDDALIEQAIETLNQYEDISQSPRELVEMPTVDVWGKKTNTQKKARRTKKEIATDEEVKAAQERGTRNASCDEITAVLLRMYEGDLRYSTTANAFFMYGYKSPGLWTELNEIQIKSDIKYKLDQLKSTIVPCGYSMNMLNDVYAQLQLALPFDDWYDDTEYLLFTNGVLDVATREFLPFNREMYMTQQLPYEYQPSATCEEIVKWLKYTQEGDWGRVLVLRAWLRAVLLGCAEIQMFVEIVGPGRSGKSSFANLAHALVGHHNAAVSSLEYLEKNRFETANLYQKKLLLFNDTERFGGNVSVLKAVTGRDLLRNEQKYQSGKKPAFKFKGMVMITANESIQTTDNTSGLARRRLTIPFNNQFRGGAVQQKVLIDMNDRGEPFGTFAPLLPGLVNWVLDMDHDEMKEYLMEADKKVNFFSQYQAEQAMRSNPIMYWMHHMVVFELNASSSIGFAKFAPPGSSGTYVNHDKWLYASYCEFCRHSNSNAHSRSRFEGLILDVCNNQLGLNIYRTKNSRGSRLVNITVRGSDPRFNDYPSIVELGFNKAKFSDFYGGIQLEYRKTDATIEST